MSKVNDFLTEAGVFYLATVDGDQPKVRPLGAHLEMDGKVLFGVGDFKDVYKQLLANPKFEICAYDGSAWIRVCGEAVLDERIEAQQHMLDENPGLKNMYKAGDGNTAVFCIKNGVAVISSFSAEPVTIEF